MGIRVLTSTWSVVNYDSKAIVQSFLFGNELGSVKKVAENLRVPLLSLQSTWNIQWKYKWKVTISLSKAHKETWKWKMRAFHPTKPTSCKQQLTTKSAPFPTRQIEKEPQQFPFRMATKVSKFCASRSVQWCEMVLNERWYTTGQYSKKKEKKKAPNHGKPRQGKRKDKTLLNERASIHRSKTKKQR